MNGGNELVADEIGYDRICVEDFQVTLLGPLRAVTFLVDDAEKAKGFAVGRAKLMPSSRRHVNEVVLLDLGDGITHEDPSRSANDHHQVGVLMPLEGAVTISRHLEVPQFHRQVVAARKQSLPMDTLKVRSRLFVGVDVHAVPGKAFAPVSNHT